MIVIASALIGAVLGVWQAHRKNGNRLDMAQYGAIFALIFAVLGVFLAIYLDRLA